MILYWVPAGFIAILLYAFWLAARIAERRQSAAFGFFTGVIMLALLWVIYLVVLARWARAELREFLETMMPLVAERALQLLEQLQLIGESL